MVRNQFAGISQIKLVFPDMAGQIRCMHSKLMLLFHEGYVRVVVPSANLTRWDWGGMGGIMENVSGWLSFYFSLLTHLFPLFIFFLVPVTLNRMPAQKSEGQLYTNRH